MKVNIVSIVFFCYFSSVEFMRDYLVDFVTSYPDKILRKNPRKFQGIFPRNPQKFPGTFHRKIRWKCRQKFRGISRYPFLGISCIPFWGISHNPFWCISRNPFQGISRYQFQVISLENNLRKCRPNLGKFSGISREKFLINQFLGISWELFPRLSQEFLRNILRYSQHIPE